MSMSCQEEEYEEFKIFTDFVSGDAWRRKQIEAAQNGEEIGGERDKKKKGKKKKR